LLQCGIVTIDEVPHAEQTFDVCERYRVGYGVYQAESVWLNKLRWCVLQSKFNWLTQLLTPIMLT